MRFIKMFEAKLRKLEKLDEKILGLQNEKKQVRQEYNEAVKKARNHRIFKRGGMIESILPESKDFTDEQMKTLLEQVLTSGFAVKRVAEITGKESEPERTASAIPAPVKTVPAITADTDMDEDESTDADSPYI